MTIYYEITLISVVASDIFRITKIKKWNRLEDQILLNLTNNKRRKNWKYISKILCTDKSARDCRERFLEISSIIKGRWSPEEDRKLKDLILTNGQKWSLVAKKLKNRTGKQVRDRYLNRLNSRIIISSFSILEDLKILGYQKMYGNKWARIAKFFVGRSPDNIKIRYHSSIKQNVKILLFIKRRDGIQIEVNAINNLLDNIKSIKDK